MDSKKMMARIKKCSTIEELENMHSMVCRFFPVRERQQYIKMINSHEEKLTKSTYRIQSFL